MLSLYRFLSPISHREAASGPSHSAGTSHPVGHRVLRGRTLI